MIGFNQRLPKQLAAKEAFDAGIIEGVTLPRIQIVNNQDGKPKIILHDVMFECFQLLGIKHNAPVY